VTRSVFSINRARKTFDIPSSPALGFVGFGRGFFVVLAGKVRGEVQFPGARFNPERKRKMHARRNLKMLNLPYQLRHKVSFSVETQNSKFCRRPTNRGLRTCAVVDIEISSDGRVLYAATTGEGIFRYEKK
jgi:hypothetical protein